MNQQKFHLVSHIFRPYMQSSIIALLGNKIPRVQTDIDLSIPPDWFSADSTDTQTQLFDAVLLVDLSLTRAPFDKLKQR